MRVLMLLKRMLVGVVFAIAIVSMQMRMNMLMLVYVYYITVSMLMSMDMFVFVSMLQLDSIFNHYVGTNNHNEQRNIELHSRSFAKYKNAEFALAALVVIVFTIIEVVISKKRRS